MLLAKAVGVTPKDVNYVAYDGGGELLTGVLGKKVAFAATGVSEVAEQAKAGDVKILAVTSADPVEGIDAPTLKSLGVDMEFTNWRGIVAPPGLSDAEKTAQYVDLLTKMHGSEQWKKTLADQGWTDAFQTGDEFKTFLTAQNDSVAGVLEELGLRHDAGTTQRPRGTDGSQGRPRQGRSETTGVALRAPAGLGVWAIDRRAEPPRPGVTRARSAPRRSRSLVGAPARRHGASCSPSTSLRGGRGEQEGGEDVDLSHGSDWQHHRPAGRRLRRQRPAHRAASAGRSPGRSSSSARPTRSAAGTTSATRSSRSRMSVGSWYLFYAGLGIKLPVGLLKGIL